MGDDSSNDASIVAITSDDENEYNSEKPIIKLFRRLIANDSKQNTILTNNQILHLLVIEFGIHVEGLHSLEVDIYITLMKKFLKDWPQWEGFDGAVNEAKKKNDPSIIDKMLQEKHDNLKTYLQSVIDIARPLAKDAVLKAKEHIENKKEIITEANESSDDAVLEVDGTRSQLYNLFLRWPVKYSVFNHENRSKSMISVNYFKIESILNWWNMNIEIRLRNKGMTVLYKREMSHEVKHVLVNKKLPIKTKPYMELDQELKVQLKNKSSVTDSFKLIDYMDKIASKYPITDCGMDEIFKFIKKDLFLLPQKVLTPACYKRYLSEYSYVRNLYVEDKNGMSGGKYDLQLEETICPLVKFQISLCGLQDPIVDEASVVVECSSCKITFRGRHLLAELREHFELHASEKAWTCTNCGLEFPMLMLAERWWSHRCVDS